MEGEARDGDRLGLGVAVQLVAQDRVAQVREVHPDLVGAPGFQLRLHQRGDGEPLEGLDVGCGRQSPSQRQGGPPRRGAGPTNGARHSNRPGQVPRHQGQVAPRHGMGAELALQVPGSRMRAGQHQDARGVAVEAVHNEEPPHLAPAPAQSPRRPRQHRILLGVHRGVDEQPGGLVHHHHVLVLVEDGDGGAVPAQAARGELGSVRHAVGRQHPLPRVEDEHVVDRDVALQDLVLRAAVGEGEPLLHRPRQALGTIGHVPTLPLPTFAPRSRPRWTGGRDPVTVKP